MSDEAATDSSTTADVPPRPSRAIKVELVSSGPKDILTFAVTGLPCFKRFLPLDELHRMTADIWERLGYAEIELPSPPRPMIMPDGTDIYIEVRDTQRTERILQPVIAAVLKVWLEVEGSSYFDLPARGDEI